jgi:acyl-CoA reductase-like NAD-dependent aldehyde dehydrogenase
MNDNDLETKQERREKKLRKGKEHMRQHGKDIAKIYHNAILKRLKEERK